MRFGDFIRGKRQDKRWSQPEAANKIGIEQSYLSKLETGKSYPSEEVFAALTRVYDFSSPELKDQLFSAELDRLREIAEVRALILAGQQQELAWIKKLVMAAIVCLAIGGASLGGALMARDTVLTDYSYQSAGVIKEGAQGFDAIWGSGDEKIRKTRDYRGATYEEQVEGGTRRWVLIKGDEIVIPSVLRWFYIPAFLFSFMGFGLFIASYRFKAR